jgi:hypothetical protein
MANGKWQMANGKWQMANGKWQMANGKWQMANGKWQMADAMPTHLAMLPQSVILSAVRAECSDARTSRRTPNALVVTMLHQGVLLKDLLLSWTGTRRVW